MTRRTLFLDVLNKFAARSFRAEVWLFCLGSCAKSPWDRIGAVAAGLAVPTICNVALGAKPAGGGAEKVGRLHNRDALWVLRLIHFLGKLGGKLAKYPVLFFA